LYENIIPVTELKGKKSFIMKDFPQSYYPIFEAFSHEQKMRFGLAVAQRMLGLYAYFSENNHFGDVSILENSIKLIQENKIENPTEWIAKLDEICPDMDDFSGDLWATVALDTVGVVYELLVMSQEATAENLTIICSLALNAPYMCVHTDLIEPYEDSRMQKEIYLLENWILQIQNNQKLEKPAYDWINYIKAVA